jgi:DNA-binding transcriptional LysR family regulator
VGIALIPRLLVEDEFARGTLVQVCRYEHQSDKAYYLIYPEVKSENPVLAAFRDWIDGEAQQYRPPARHPGRTLGPASASSAR